MRRNITPEMVNALDIFLDGDSYTLDCIATINEVIGCYVQEEKIRSMTLEERFETMEKLVDIRDFFEHFIDDKSKH